MGRHDRLAGPSAFASGAARKGRYVLHIEREPQYWVVDAEGKPAGWRGHLGSAMSAMAAPPRYSSLEAMTPSMSSARRIPPELYDMVARSSKQPAIEDLDI